MNLNESVRFVLKNSGQSLLHGFVYDDLKSAFSQIKDDFQLYTKEAKKLKKKGNFLNRYLQLKDHAVEGLHVMREAPSRVKHGFNVFRESFLEELEKLEDPRDKAIFSMKVLGALSTFAAGAFYELRKSGSTIQVPGLVQKTALGEFLLTALMVRLSQLFVLRFIGEIEKHVSDQEDLDKLHFFKQMLSGKHDVDRPTEDPENDREDKAFQLVDTFKNYIMTGKES